MRPIAHRPAFTLVEMLVTLAIIVLLAALIFPVFANVRKQAHKDVCLSNLKQLGAAIALYASDYDDKLPYAPDAIAKVTVLRGMELRGEPLDSLIRTLPDLWLVLKPYGVTTAQFRCPLDKSFLFTAEPGHKPTFFEEFGSSYNYRYEFALDGRLLSGFSQPASTPLMYDYSLFNEMDFEHGGMLKVLFADLHVKAMPHTKVYELVDKEK